MNKLFLTTFLLIFSSAVWADIHYELKGQFFSISEDGTIVNNEFKPIIDEDTTIVIGSAKETFNITSKDSCVVIKSKRRVRVGIIWSNYDLFFKYCADRVVLSIDHKSKTLNPNVKKDHEQIISSIKHLRREGNYFNDF